MNRRELHEFEADRIALYLVGEPPRAQEKARYVAAMGILDCRLGRREEAFWRRMLKMRAVMACGDAGLALLAPLSPLRRKVFTMVAILEASPHYTRHFLSREYSRWHLCRAGWTAVGAIGRAAVGMILVKIGRVA